MVTATPTAPAFSSPEVCDRANITYRQLDYWTRRGYLHPTNPTPGTGYSRIWPEAEVVKAVELARMLHDGITWTKAASLIAAGSTATLAVTELPETLP